MLQEEVLYEISCDKPHPKVRFLNQKPRRKCIAVTLNPEEGESQIHSLDSLYLYFRDCFSPLTEQRSGGLDGTTFASLPCPEL